MAQAGIPNVFVMCLGPSGGSLALGHGPYREDSVQYTPIITESYYVVTMRDFLVSGQYRCPMCHMRCCVKACVLMRSLWHGGHR